MVHLITPYAQTYRTLQDLPESVRYEMVLSRDSFLSTRSTIYGPCINLVWVYDNFGMLRRLKLHKHTTDVYFICDPIKFYAFLNALKAEGINPTYSPVDNHQIECFVRAYFNLTLDQSKFVCRFYRYRLKVIMSNADSVVQFALGIRELAVRVPEDTYETVLRYIAGDYSVSTELYLATLAKYRDSGKHIVEFLQKSLELYMKTYLGTDVAKLTKSFNNQRIILKLSELLTYEQAYLLHSELAGKRCKDLLRRCRFEVSV